MDFEESPPLRAFVGLDLPDAAREAAARTQALWKERLPAGVGWTDPANFHITFVFLGALPPERLARAQDILRACARRFAPARLALGAPGAFPGTGKPRVLVLGVDDPDGRLAALREALVAAYSTMGYRPNHEVFRPHVTLGYTHDRSPVSISHDLAPAPHAWVASRITLFVGRDTPAGLRYLPVDIRPLCARPA